MEKVTEVVDPGEEACGIVEYGSFAFGVGLGDNGPDEVPSIQYPFTYPS